MKEELKSVGMGLGVLYAALDSGIIIFIIMLLM